MKILFCINSLVKGGAERVVSNLANYFSSENEVTIMTLVNYDIEYVLKDNISIVKLDRKKVDPYKEKNKLIKYISKIPKLISRIFKMKKQIKKIEPDIIISFLPETSFLVLFNKRKKDKVIVSVRNDPKIEYSSKIYYFIMKKLYPRANGFVFQTPDAREYFNNIIKCYSKIIPNSINPIFISDSYAGNRKKEIVSVGRLVEQKNFDLLIDAFYMLSEKYKEYKLIIYGEGKLRNKLEEKIKDLGIQDKVILPGIVDNVKEKIYRSSVFVLPSLYEGMPNALMEAMALGLPVISTDCPCGGPRMLITNNINGKLVSVNDKEIMKEAIEEIIKNEEFSRKLGKEASKISITLNPENINREWKDFIESILEKNR